MYCFTDQAIRERPSHPYRNITTRRRQNRAGSGEVQRLVLARTPNHLPTLLVMTFDRSFINIAYLLVVISSLQLALTVKQRLKPLRFLVLRNGIGHVNRWRVRSLRILKRKDRVVLDLRQQIHRSDEVVRSLPGKSDD